MSSWIDELCEALERSGLRVTFDPERDFTKPCWNCGDSSTPRDLVDVGHYLNQHRDEMTRPICATCRQEAPFK